MRIVSATIIALLLPCVLIALSVSAEERSSATSRPDSESQSPKSEKPEKKSDRESNLDFSGTGRPGQQTAGESRGSCINASQPIEAMLPESNVGKTVATHPRFWVYFPEIASNKTETEFIIQNESREDIWRSRSALNSTTGYQSFSLPETAPPLKIDRWYRWYVKVYCHDRVASAQYVQGWVRRVPLNSKLDLELQQNPQHTHIAYGKHRIWYDAIDKLLSSYDSHPENFASEQHWQNFTQAKGVQLEGLPSPDGSRVSQQ